MAGIAFVGKRHDGVDAVIASVELNDDQHPTVGLWLGGTGGLGEEAGNRGRQGQEGGGLEKITA